MEGTAEEETMMEGRIGELLTELVSMKSLTGSAQERLPAQWFVEFFRSLPYFRDRPEDMGAYAIPDDPYGRSIPYALLRGRRPDTVVLSGHFDVVSAEEYGAAEEYAYRPGSAGLEERLRDFPLSEEQRRDLGSGEWLWGRGTADMKGGLCVHAALFEQFAARAEAGTLEGGVLFVPVPDEESYSAGMRGAVEILRMFRRRYALDYKLLIDPEPARTVDGAQVFSLGSVGKVMPAILVQTKKAHAGRFFEGFSALDVLADICLRTNGSLSFCDVCGDEATVPPTWAGLRDRKRGYDASIPHRAGGYLTVLSFSSTPEDIEDRLRRVCAEAFIAQAERLDRTYQRFKTMDRSERRGHIRYEPCVMSFRELCALLRERDPAGFERAYAAARGRAAARVARGEASFPEATVDMMEEALDWSGIRHPVTLIGFAPPYYPPVHSDRVRGKEGFGTKALRFVSELSEREHRQPVVSENYFMGISDLSYGAVTAPFDYKRLSEAMPLWGSAYSVDLDAMEEIGIPGVIYGPIGKDYHTFAERVNRRSLFHVVPAVTRALIEYMWTV